MLQNVEWLNSNTTRTYPLLEGNVISTFPKNALLDLVLFETETHSIVDGESKPVLYGIHKIVRDNVPSAPAAVGEQPDAYTKPGYRYYVREFASGAYDQGDPTTFKDVGYFFQPRDAERGYASPLYLENQELTYSGRAVFNTADKNLSTVTYHPDSVVIQPCACIPRPNSDDYVRTLQDSVGTSLRGDVQIAGEDGFIVTTNTLLDGTSVIGIQFEDPDECPNDIISNSKLVNIYNSNVCEVETAKSNLCAGYALTINKVGPTNTGNVQLLNKAPIQVSAFPKLKPGGDPSNVADYNTSALIVHYNGHIMESFSGGSRVVGLVCKWMPKADPTDVKSMLSVVASLAGV